MPHWSRHLGRSAVAYSFRPGELALRQMSFYRTIGRTLKKSYIWRMDSSGFLAPSKVGSMEGFPNT